MHTKMEFGSPSEMEDAIRAQREMSEAVASLATQLKRVKVTAGARIDHIDNPEFSHELPSAKQQQQNLVGAAEAAVATAELASAPHRFYLTEEQAGAVVDEALVAMMNDLMLSGEREAFFGVSMPDFDIDMTSNSWHEDAVGLLAYRAWQLLTRTPKGREILVKADAPLVDGLVGQPDSYAAVHAAITKPLYTGCIVDFFERCVLALPRQSRVTEEESYNQPCLTRKEGDTLLAAIRHGELNWRVVSSPT